MARVPISSCCGPGGQARARPSLLEFTRTVSALRAAHPVFRRRRFFDGLPVRRRGVEGMPDISWFQPDGSEMSDEDWDSGLGKSVAVYLNGQGIPGLDARGHRVTDDSFVLCFNAHHEPIEFTLPPEEFGPAWTPVIDTAAGADDGGEASPVRAGATVRVGSRGIVVLGSRPVPGTQERVEIRFSAPSTR